MMSHKEGVKEVSIFAMLGQKAANKLCNTVWGERDCLSVTPGHKEKGIEALGGVLIHCKRVNDC